MRGILAENSNAGITMPIIVKSVRRPWVPEKKPFGGRAVDNTKFYQSTPWRKLREKVLKERPLCEQCRREGRITPAKVVDHIIPIVKGGAPLDESNLQPLCHKCHNKKSATDK